MLHTNYDINKIENELKTVVKNAGLSLNVYTGDRPSIVDNTLNELVVVSVVSTLSDMMAYGRCICAIDMFSKDLSNGCKNGVKLSIMTQKAVNMLPINSVNYVFSNEVNVIPLGSDGYGYHVERIQFTTFIKTT